MNFQPELAAKVMAGTKTVTRRLVSDNKRSPWWREKCSLVVGRDYAVCPGRGKHAIGRVIILDKVREPLGWLDDREAQREGFPGGRLEFSEAFYAINGVYEPTAHVWRVEFIAITGPLCGRIMVGAGGDTYDPLCVLPDGHRGDCKSPSAIDQHRLRRAPVAA